jgi:hypothetical protein
MINYRARNMESFDIKTVYDNDSKLMIGYRIVKNDLSDKFKLYKDKVYINNMLRDYCLQLVNSRI